MSESQSSVRLSFPALEVLAVIFIILKVIGKLDWSWWAVLSPLWVPLAFIGAIAVLLFLVTVLIALFQ